MSDKEQTIYTTDKNGNAAVRITIEDGSGGGGGGGTTNYEDLHNLPQINGVELKGDLSGADLGLTDATTTEELTERVEIIENKLVRKPYKYVIGEVVLWNSDDPNSVIEASLQPTARFLEELEFLNPSVIKHICFDFNSIMVENIKIEGKNFQTMGDFRSFVQSINDLYFPVRMRIYYKQLDKSKIRITTYNNLYSQIIGRKNLRTGGTRLKHWLWEPELLATGNSGHTTRTLLRLLYNYSFGKNLKDSELNMAVRTVFKGARHEDVNNIRADSNSGYLYGSFLQYNHDRYLYSPDIDEFESATNIFNITNQSDTAFFHKTLYAIWNPNQQLEIIDSLSDHKDMLSVSIVVIHQIEAVASNGKKYYMFKIIPATRDTVVIREVDMDKFKEDENDDPFSHNYLVLTEMQYRSTRKQYRVVPNFSFGSGNVPNSTWFGRFSLYTSNIFQGMTWMRNPNQRFDLQLKFLILYLTTGMVSGLSEPFYFRHNIRNMSRRSGWRF